MKLKIGNTYVNGWLSTNNSFIAESMSKMGWDTLTIDMQHGQSDYNTSISMLQAMSKSKALPFVRVPWNEPGILMKMLDLGVLGIIAPMINNKSDCQKFVDNCYYPPVGKRSFGPMRAQLIYGPDYYQNSLDLISTLAMIETQEAFENIDEILSVPNLTGIYIGPSDLSISYGLEPKFDVKTDKIFSKIKIIAEKAKDHGKIAGIHNGSTKYAKEMIELGYQFVTISSDFRSMTSHAQNIIDEMKNNNGIDNSSSSY